MQRPLVHIGYHKTATTWLQRTLFRAGDFVQPLSSSEIRSTLVADTPLDFDDARARALLGDSTAAVLAQAKVPVLSDERLSGSPHGGGYDSALIADRLVECLPDANILIVIREQRSMAQALHQQYVRDGGTARLDHYLHPRNPYELPQFRAAHLEYDRLIRYYTDRFPGHVEVLAFENLLAAASRFVEAVCAHAGVSTPAVPLEPTYSAWSPLSIAVKRHANRFLVRNSLNPGGFLHVRDLEDRIRVLDRWLPRRGRSRTGRAQTQIERWASGRFGRSNRETAELTGIDLGALGYDMS